MKESQPLYKEQVNNYEIRAKETLEKLNNLKLPNGVNLESALEPMELYVEISDLQFKLEDSNAEQTLYLGKNPEKFLETLGNHPAFEDYFEEYLPDNSLSEWIENHQKNFLKKEATRNMENEVKIDFIDTQKLERTMEENQEILQKLQEELGLYDLFEVQNFQDSEKGLGVRLNRFMGTENKPITAIEMVGNEIHYPYDIERMTNITKGEVIEKVAQLIVEKEYVTDKGLRFNQQTNQITGAIQGIDIGDDVEYSHDKWIKEFDLSILSDQELSALTYNQLNQLKSSAEEVKSYYSSRDEEENDYFTWKADFEARSFSFSELSKELLNRNVLTPTIPFITGRDESELLELDKMLRPLQEECRDVVKENKKFQAPESSEAKFEVSKAQVENAIAQAQERFKAEVLSQGAENIYEASDEITYVEGALGELEITFEGFNYQEYENPEYTQGKQFAAMIDLQEAEGINPSLFQFAAEQSYFKTDGPYIPGEDLDAFMDYFVEDYLELEPYIEKIDGKSLSEEVIREKDEVWIYDPKDTEEGVPWTKPWHAGNVGDRIKELQNMISEAGSDGMIELNEEKSISKDPLEKELEIMVDYTKSGDKGVLPKKFFINPKPDDFQKANIKEFGLRQKENLGEFIKGYHTEHPISKNNNVHKTAQEIGR